MKKQLFTLLLSIASTFLFAQSKQIDCFIIDNPTLGTVDVYVVARGGEFTTQHAYWADMGITLSALASPNNLGEVLVKPDNYDLIIGGTSFSSGNTYSNKSWILLKDPRGSSTPSFTYSGRNYFKYNFAGLSNNPANNFQIAPSGSIGQEATLRQNVPVFMGSIPKNGNAFADIEILVREIDETDFNIILQNASYTISIDNNNASFTGLTYKEDIIHFDNRFNQPGPEGVTTAPYPPAMAWRSGTASGEPNLTDGARNLTIYNGPAEKTMIGAVNNTQFLDNTNIIVNPDAGFQTTTITPSAAVGEDSIIVLADATGYGQYIGPTIAGLIQQYVGTSPGWRNMAFPINPSSAADNGLSLGGAPINFNTTSSSYHTTTTNRDACGSFGNWINTINMYTFTGASGSAQPHEWYGADENTVGGTVGYSVFLGNSFFPTSGTIETKGQFNAGGISYSYAHNTPHALNTNGASQALYTGVGCTEPIEVPADRKANWDGWALVANPYPSGLDVNTFADNNGIARSNVRVWNRGKAYNIVGSSGIDYQYESMEDRIVPPMQAFFVKVGGDGDVQTLNFNDAQRAFSNEDFLKTSAEHVKVIATNLADSAINHAILAFDPVATNSYDIAFDSYVLSQPRNTTPQIGFHHAYTTKGQTVVAPLYVNTVNENQPNGSYPLRFWSRSSGNYSFNLDQTALNPAWKIYIEDTKLAPGSSVDITNSNFTFNYLITDNPTRFILHFANTALSDNPFTAAPIRIWPYTTADEIIVVFEGITEPITELSIYNALGQVLVTSKNVNPNEHFVYISGNNKSNMYMIRVTLKNGTQQNFKVLK